MCAFGLGQAGSQLSILCHQDALCELPAQHALVDMNALGWSTWEPHAGGGYFLPHNHEIP